MKKRFAGTLTLVVVILFPFVTFAADGDAANGEKLWKSKKCKKCHHLTKKRKAGPGVKGVTKKRSEAWLIKWMKDPQKTWEENDAETQELRKWKKGLENKKKTTMKMKKKLTGREVADLIAFMKKNDET